MEYQCYWSYQSCQSCPEAVQSCWRCQSVRAVQSCQSCSELSRAVQSCPELFKAVRAPAALRLWCSQSLSEHSPGCGAETSFLMEDMILDIPGAPACRVSPKSFWRALKFLYNLAMRLKDSKKYPLLNGIKKKALHAHLLASWNTYTRGMWPYTGYLSSIGVAQSIHDVKKDASFMRTSRHNCCNFDDTC
jgi:hypothetical protein